MSTSLRVERSGDVSNRNGAADHASIDLSRLIDEAPIRSSHIVLLALCMAVALVDGYDTQALAYALSSISAEWHVRPAAFAPAFTSGLFGLAVGAIAFGQLGDRFGRKPLILCAVALFGVCTLAIAEARGLSDLVVLRLFIGIGLGGVLPNAATLVADVSPRIYRRPAVMVVMGCLAAGAFIGGLVAGALIPDYGWRSVFYVGGGCSLAVCAVCIFALSESPLFLALRHGSSGACRTYRHALHRPDRPARPVHVSRHANAGGAPVRPPPLRQRARAYHAATLGRDGDRAFDSLHIGPLASDAGQGKRQLTRAFAFRVGLFSALAV